MTVALALGGRVTPAGTLTAGASHPPPPPPPLRGGARCIHARTPLLRTGGPPKGLAVAAPFPLWRRRHFLVSSPGPPPAHPHRARVFQRAPGGSVCVNPPLNATQRCPPPPRPNLITRRGAAGCFSPPQCLATRKEGEGPRKTGGVIPSDPEPLPKDVAYHPAQHR